MQLRSLPIEFKLIAYVTQARLSNRSPVAKDLPVSSETVHRPDFAPPPSCLNFLAVLEFAPFADAVDERRKPAEGTANHGSDFESIHLTPLACRHSGSKVAGLRAAGFAVTVDPGVALPPLPSVKGTEPSAPADLTDRRLDCGRQDIELWPPTDAQSNGDVGGDCWSCGAAAQAAGRARGAHRSERRSQPSPVG